MAIPIGLVLELVSTLISHHDQQAQQHDQQAAEHRAAAADHRDLLDQVKALPDAAAPQTEQHMRDRLATYERLFELMEKARALKDGPPSAPASGP